MEKFPYWKSPGPFRHRQSSGEEYVGLGLTLWCKKMPDNEVAGPAKMVMVTSWQPKGE